MADERRLEGGWEEGRVGGGKCTHLLCGVCSKIGPKVGVVARGEDG